jgi:uncharacterized membrane protein
MTTKPSKLATSGSSQPADYHHPETVEELTRHNVKTVLELEQKAKQQRTTTDRAADVITNFCGSMPFVWAHVIWFGAWVFVNGVPGIKHFDPFPFTFLTLCVSLEAIFLSAFILISQTHETRLSERRNHLDLQINLLTEQEITKILSMLKIMADKMGADVSQDPEIEVLEKSTQPDMLAEQIDQAVEASKPGSSN